MYFNFKEEAPDYKKITRLNLYWSEKALAFLENRDFCSRILEVPEGIDWIITVFKQSINQLYNSSLTTQEREQIYEMNSSLSRFLYIDDYVVLRLQIPLFILATKEYRTRLEAATPEQLSELTTQIKELIITSQTVAQHNEALQLLNKIEAQLLKLQQDNLPLHTLKQSI